MKKRSLILVCFLFSGQSFAQEGLSPLQSSIQEQEAVQYDFIKPYNEIRKTLREIPSKQVEKTPYCSRINLLIDQASTAGKADPNLKADRIVISKTRRKMYLLSRRTLVSEYDVAFGFGLADGAKSQMADGRTPEGIYTIDFKKKNSNYNKALHVSYPNDFDEEFAKKNKVNPGGSIMIHGFPKSEIDGLDPILIPQIHPRVDWTQGCIAVSDKEIEEVYSLVDEGATVEICPFDESHQIAKSEVVAPETQPDLDPANR